MPTYVGVSNVLRSVPRYRVGVGNVGRDVYMAYGGVANVARPLLGTDIDHIEIYPRYIDTRRVTINADYSTDVVENLGSTLAIARQYGSVDIGNNSINVGVTQRQIEIQISGWVNLIMKNGSSKYLRTYATERAVPYQLTVDSAISFSGYNNVYITQVLGINIITGTIGSSASQTKVITDTSGTYTDSFYVGAAVGGNSSYCSQTYRSCVVNNISVPVLVRNGLS